MSRYSQPRDPHPLGERVTLLEHGMAQFRAETQSGFAQINQRFDSLDRELSDAKTRWGSHEQLAVGGDHAIMGLSRRRGRTRATVAKSKALARSRDSRKLRPACVARTRIAGIKPGPRQHFVGIVQRPGCRSPKPKTSVRVRVSAPPWEIQPCDDLEASRHRHG